MEFLEQPVKLWHLIILGIGIAASLHTMQKQLNAIGQSVWKIYDRLNPSPYGED